VDTTGAIPWVGGVGSVVDVTMEQAKHTGNAINAKTIKENNMFFFIVFSSFSFGFVAIKSHVSHPSFPLYDIGAGALVNL
jgi:hypothetical protein